MATMNQLLSLLRRHLLAVRAMESIIENYSIKINKIKISKDYLMHRKMSRLDNMKSEDKEE